MGLLTGILAPVVPSPPPPTLGDVLDGVGGLITPVLELPEAIAAAIEVTRKREPARALEAVMPPPARIYLEAYR